MRVSSKSKREFRGAKYPDYVVNRRERRDEI